MILTYFSINGCSLIIISINLLQFYVATSINVTCVCLINSIGITRYSWTMAVSRVLRYIYITFVTLRPNARSHMCAGRSQVKLKYITQQATSFNTLT